jgi:hypothetical protein
MKGQVNANKSDDFHPREASKITRRDGNCGASKVVNL